MRFAGADVETAGLQVEAEAPANYSNVLSAPAGSEAQFMVILIAKIAAARSAS